MKEEKNQENGLVREITVGKKAEYTKLSGRKKTSSIRDASRKNIPASACMYTKLNM